MAVKVQKDVKITFFIVVLVLVLVSVFVCICFYWIIFRLILLITVLEPIANLRKPESQGKHRQH